MEMNSSGFAACGKDPGNGSQWDLDSAHDSHARDLRIADGNIFFKALELG
jgi:hypothetical protein